MVARIRLVYPSEYAVDDYASARLTMTMSDGDQ